MILRPRMRRVVGLLQPLGRDVRINLRRDEMRVAEQFLHAAQIRARVQQVRRVTVPQLVRRQARIKSGDDEILFQPPRQLHAAGAARPFSFPQKKPATPRTAAACSVRQ